MEKNSKRLSELETPEEFAKWLWEGLADYYQVTPESNKYSELKSLISGREYAVEALINIYDLNVPKNRQASFRQSIGIALHKCVEIQNPKVFEVVNDLTYLIAGAKATESLDGLLENLETTSNEHIAQNRERLLYSTMGVLLALPSDNRVYDFTHKLVNSPSFNKGHIFSVIEIMVRCKPGEYQAIVDEFKDRIQTIYCQVKGIEKEEKAYWEAVNLTISNPAVRELITSITKPNNGEAGSPSTQNSN